VSEFLLNNRDVLLVILGVLLPVEIGYYAYRARNKTNQKIEHFKSSLEYWEKNGEAVTHIQNLSLTTSEKSELLDKVSLEYKNRLPKHNPFRN